MTQQRTIPVAEVLTKVVARIRSRAAAFVPPLKLVELDEDWQIPVVSEDLVAKLPLVMVTLMAAPMDRVPGPEALSLDMQIHLNHLSQIPSSGPKRTQVFQAACDLGALFSSGDVFDDFDDLTGAEIEEVSCTGISTSQSLVEHNIAWGITSISIKVHTT